MPSYRSGVCQMIVTLGRQTVNPFIRRDEDVKSAVFRDFMTLVEGHGEGLWVSVVL